MNRPVAWKTIYKDMAERYLPNDVGAWWFSWCEDDDPTTFWQRRYQRLRRYCRKTKERT